MSFVSNVISFKWLFFICPFSFGWNENLSPKEKRWSHLDNQKKVETLTICLVYEMQETIVDEIMRSLLDIDWIVCERIFYDR